MLEDLEGSLNYSAWWQLLLAIAMELEAELDVQSSLDCEVGVSVPHSGNHLANRLYRVLNHAGLYLTPTGGDVPVLYYLAEASMMGTRSLYETSGGLRYTYRKNEEHFAQ